MSPDTHLHLRERRLSVEEYFALGEASILDEDDCVELLDGRLIDMPPIGPSNSHNVDDLEELFAQRLYKPEETMARIRIQSPIQLDGYRMPEPDVVLYDPDMPKDQHPHPEDIYLVIEVADTTVDYDRQVKADRYAQRRFRSTGSSICQGRPSTSFASRKRTAMPSASAIVAAMSCRWRRCRT